MKRALVLSFLVACNGSAASPETQPAPPPAPAPAAQRAGVAHADVIIRVSLAPRGDAALTVDRSGSVRYWPALDGSAPAVLLPLHDPRQLALGPAGGSTRLVASISGSDNVELGELDQAGRYRVTARLAPRVRAYAVRALAGKIAVLGKDNIVQLVTAQGEVLARWERPGFRPAQVLASADGNRLVAIMVDERQDNTFPGEARTIQVGDRSLTDGPVRELTFRPIASTPDFDLSPDGTRLIMLERGEGEAGLLVLPLDKGDLARIALPSTTWPHVARFVDDQHVVAIAPENAPGWNITLGDKPEATPRPPRKGRAALDPVPASVAGGQGQLVQATGAFLSLERGAEVTYLGQVPLKPWLAAVSPSGQRLASTVRGGKRVVLDDVAGQRFAELPGEPDDVTALAFLDEDHLLIADMAGKLRTVSVADGKVVSESSAPPGTTRIAVARGQVALGTDRSLTGLYQAGQLDKPLPLESGQPGGLTTGQGAGSWQLKDGKVLLGGKSGAAVPGEVIAVDGDGGTWSLEQAKAPDPSQAIIAIRPAADTDDPEARPDSATATQAVVRRGADGKELWRTVLPVGSTRPQVSQGGNVVYSTFLGVLAMLGPDGSERWSRRLDQAPRVMVLSADDSRLLVATGSGLLLLDGKSGQTLYSRCGAGFVASAELPEGAEPPGTLGSCSL